MMLYRKSPITGETNVMDIKVTREQLNAWESGKLIQDALPHLTPGERDFIKLGITEDEWDTYLKQENEDE